MPKRRRTEDPDDSKRDLVSLLLESVSQTHEMIKSCEDQEQMRWLTTQLEKKELELKNAVETKERELKVEKKELEQKFLIHNYMAGGRLQTGEIMKSTSVIDAMEDRFVYDETKLFLDISAGSGKESGLRAFEDEDVKEKGMRIFSRKGLREQMDFMQKRVMQAGSLGWVLGAPGTGKSLTGLAFALSIDREVWGVSWMHISPYPAKAVQWIAARKTV